MWSRGPYLNYINWRRWGFEFEFGEDQKSKYEEAWNGLSFLELSGARIPNPVSKLQGDKYLGEKEGKKLGEDDE